MGIQSSVNGLMQQIYTMGAISAGLRQQKKQTNEAKIQTEIAAGNAPLTEDGKVDTEWLQNKRDEILFYPNGKISAVGKAKARILEDKIKGGGEFKLGDIGFYTDDRVQEYLKSFNEKKAAELLANKRVIERTDSIKQAKSNFDEHVASLIKYYSKGSGNP